MASLREAARWVLDEARDGIAWITVSKEGRGWKTSAFSMWQNLDGTVTLDYAEDLATLREIFREDPNAIIVNGYEDNLAVDDYRVTLQDLANALRWQYDLQNARLSDFLERIVQPE